VIHFRRMAEGNKTHFLNVDLELRASKELSELAKAFEPGAMILSCMAMEHGYLANLELASQPANAEVAIRDFVSLIEKLPPPARALWNDAKRDFSIGVGAGSIPSSFELALTPEVLKIAAEVGARITFVVYVHDRASPTSPSP
jgi:hypothetical protein